MTEATKESKPTTLYELLKESVTEKIEKDEEYLALKQTYEVLRPKIQEAEKAVIKYIKENSPEYVVGSDDKYLGYTEGYIHELRYSFSWQIDTARGIIDRCNIRLSEYKKEKENLEAKLPKALFKGKLRKNIKGISERIEQMQTFIEELTKLNDNYEELKKQRLNADNTIKGKYKDYARAVVIENRNHRIIEELFYDALKTEERLNANHYTYYENGANYINASVFSAIDYINEQIKILKMSKYKEKMDDLKAQMVSEADDIIKE